MTGSAANVGVGVAEVLVHVEDGIDAIGGTAIAIGALTLTLVVVLVPLTFGSVANIGDSRRTFTLPAEPGRTA